MWDSAEIMRNSVEMMRNSAEMMRDSAELMSVGVEKETDIRQPLKERSLIVCRNCRID